MHYKRNLSDLKDVKKNGYKVFTTFACGGGSTMGYKNAGYDVVGHCDIDPQMIKVYKENHKPKHSFHMGIGDFNKLDNKDLPQELFNIDILDGSPPCSTFSTAGLREKARGKKKKFREGQASQVLDDLFFQFLDTVEKIQPKVVISENVSGMIKGLAKGYVKLIHQRFLELGYVGQVFLLNGATMGLPQKRERVFFCYHKQEYDLPRLVLDFNDKSIPFSEIEDKDDISEVTSPLVWKYYDQVRLGKNFSTVHPKGNYFSVNRLCPDKTLPTITANHRGSLHYRYKRRLNKKELSLGSSFPLDYNYLKIRPKYLMGMSVPPLMMYMISKEIKEQRLDKINKVQ